MKKTTMTLLTLLSISVFLTLYQWKSIEQTKSQTVEPLSHSEVSFFENRLSIEHTYKGLDRGLYTLTLPKDSTNLSCEFTKSDRACQPKSTDNGYQLTLKNVQTIRFKYEKSLPTNERLIDWQMSISVNGNMLQPTYDVTIRDYKSQVRTWMAPSVIASDIQRDFVRFYRFEPTSLSSFPLVLHPGKARQIWNKDGLFVTYSQESPLTQSLKQRLIELDGLYDLTFVELDKNQSVMSESYISINGRNLEQLEKKIFKDYILKNTEITNQEWLLSVLFSLYFKDISKVPEKESEQARMIEQTLLEKQLAELKKNLLNNSNKKSLVSTFDHILAQVYGKPTSFAAYNQQSTSIVPLFFEEPKNIRFHSKIMNWKAVEYKGHNYYPFTKFSKQASYTITVLKEMDSYRVTIDQNQYRFFVNQPTFIYNQEQFGVAKDLLKVFNGHTYMKGQYVEDLLNLEISEGADTIYIEEK